jgi:hypothetical protein
MAVFGGNVVELHGDVQLGDARQKAADLNDDEVRGTPPAAACAKDESGDREQTTE